MDQKYVLLTGNEEMWARMLMEVLKDNGVPCTSVPVHGVGFVLKTGMQDSLRVFVPAEKLAQGEEVLQALFSAELVEE